MYEVCYKEITNFICIKLSWGNIKSMLSLHFTCPLAPSWCIYRASKSMFWWLEITYLKIRKIVKKARDGCTIFERHFQHLADKQTYQSLVYFSGWHIIYKNITWRCPKCYWINICICRMFGSLLFLSSLSCLSDKIRYCIRRGLPVVKARML